ncbi:MAG: hypothetical protein ACI8RZ_004812 [Myxococcota bacterium]|jgi:hypothetical protein
MIWILLTGCALNARHSGLLEVDGSQLRLHEPFGSTRVLIPGTDDPELFYLGGCGVEIEGATFLRRMTVRRWRVTDAGDGSQPFIGSLSRPGAQYLLEDWNTGTTLYLDPDSLGTLAEHVGDTVLVVGFVSGAQQVTVVSWRSLSGE